MEVAIQVIKKFLPTTISIGLLVVGFATWLANISFRTDANSKDIEKIDEREQKLESIKADIAVVKFKVDLIESIMEKKYGPHN